MISVYYVLFREEHAELFAHEKVKKGKGDGDKAGTGTSRSKSPPPKIVTPQNFFIQHKTEEHIKKNPEVKNSNSFMLFETRQCQPESQSWENPIQAY